MRYCVIAGMAKRLGHCVYSTGAAGSIPDAAMTEESRGGCSGLFLFVSAVLGRLSSSGAGAVVSAAGGPLLPEREGGYQGVAEKQGVSRG